MRKKQHLQPPVTAILPCGISPKKRKTYIKYFPFYPVKSHLAKKKTVFYEASGLFFGTGKGFP